jgi:hypothetical protein
MGATVLQMRLASNEEAETCYECGVEFASPVLAKRLEDGKSFWCPNGHSQHYLKTTSQRLREELAAEKARREQAERDVEWQRAEKRKAEDAAVRAKSALKRVEKRVNAGVCPHCNRTFQQLARHMQCKHAEIVGGVCPTPQK